MKMNVFNDEVLYADEKVVKVSSKDIEVLKQKATQNVRERVRLCTHQSVEDNLHEMIIVHAKDTYVPPHKHLNKIESFHIIEGEVDVVLFDDAGLISEVISMGDYASGKNFYYRLSDSYFHTLLISSDVLVFHETTNGPFNREDMLFADWAPNENNEVERQSYQKNLIKKVESYKAS